MLNWLKMHFIPHEGNNHRPKILHKNNVHRIIGFVLFVEVFAFLIPTIAFVGRADNGAILPSVLSSLTNQARAAQHLPPLTINPKLNEAAQAKAEDMAKNGYFAHVSPDGKTPWYWIEQSGYSYSHAGENLAVNFTDSQDVANAWMSSPDHRANILKANYTEVGTGVAEGMYEGYDTIFVAQDFGTPVVASLATQPIVPTTTPVPTAKTDVLGAQTTVAPVPHKTTPVPAKTVVSHSGPVVAPVAPTVTPQAPGDQLASAAPIIHPSLLQQLQASPRNTTNTILFTILAIVVLAVFLNIGIKISHHYPDLIMNGFMVVAVIGTVFVMNNYIVKSNTTLVQSVDYTAEHTIL